MSLRTRVPWALAAIAILATIASLLILAGALRTQRQTDSDIRQHFENVLTLRRTQALLVDAETGQRGFLLTSNPSFLAPYLEARSQVPAELADLVRSKVVSSGDPLEKLSIAKIRELALTLSLASSGRRDAALTMVDAGTGKAYMDSIRAETTSLINAQQQAINAALARSERYSRDTYGALGLLIFCSIVLLWLGLSMSLRTQRLEAETLRLREVEQAELQTRLVARELNHRVKNLFSVVLAIVQLAGRGAVTPKDAVSRIRERVQALARAHEISLGTNPMSDFDMEAMLLTLLAPYTSNIAKLELSGPPIQLPVMRVTPIGLIVHELATNAVKYGAWSGEGGEVAVTWSVSEGQRFNGTSADVLHLRWNENRTDPLDPERAGGFGSKLINAAVAQLEGTLTRKRARNGISIIIDAPIIPAAPAGPKEYKGEGNVH